MHACVISDSSLPSEGIWSKMITYIVRHSFQTTQPSICVFYLTIKQRGRVVYERIVNEEEAWLDYSLIDNEAELSNCFSIHSQLYLTIFALIWRKKPQIN